MTMIQKNRSSFFRAASISSRPLLGVHLCFLRTLFSRRNPIPSMTISISSTVRFHQERPFKPRLFLDFERLLSATSGRHNTVQTGGQCSDLLGGTTNSFSNSPAFGHMLSVIGRHHSFPPCFLSSSTKSPRPICIARSIGLTRRQPRNVRLSCIRFFAFTFAPFSRRRRVIS